MKKSEDLTGKKFGLLTVQEKLSEKENRYFLWRCKCECGRECKVSTKHLKRGTIKSCGCISDKTARNGSIAEDLTGKHFGDLTALYRGENQSGRTTWVCRCSCGKLHTAKTKELKAGKCKSCGCKQYITNKYYIDLTNRKFDMLTALYKTKKRDSKGSVYWHCKCECGKETDVTADALINLRKKSCGCLKEKIKNEIKDQLHMIDGTCVEWLKSRKYRCDNTSGFRGVYALKNGKFTAKIGFKKKTFYIGKFESFEEAKAARIEVEELIHKGFVEAYYKWRQTLKENPGLQEESFPLIFDVEKRNGDFFISTNMR